MKVAFSATGFWRINNKGKELNGDLYLNEEEGGIVSVSYTHLTLPTNSLV